MGENNFNPKMVIALSGWWAFSPTGFLNPNPNPVSPLFPTSLFFHFSGKRIRLETEWQNTNGRSLAEQKKQKSKMDWRELKPLTIQIEAKPQGQG